MSGRADILRALEIERDVADLRHDRPQSAESQLLRIHVAAERASSELLDGITTTKRGITLTHDDMRLALAAMAIASQAVALLEFLELRGVDPAELCSYSCWYCKHAQESSRDGCVYCATKRIHKPDARPCEDEFERRTS